MAYLVKSTGVMEVGYRLDFHNVTSDSADATASITIHPTTGFYMGHTITANGDIKTAGTSRNITCD